MATAGSGLAGARRKLGSSRRSLRLTKHGTLAPVKEIRDSAKFTKEMAARMKNLSKPLRKGAADIKTLIDDSFVNQRGPDGVPWKPLTEATKQQRMYDYLFGRHRGKKDKVLAKSSRGSVSRKRTTYEKAQDTAKKAGKLTKAQQTKKAGYTPKTLIDTGRLRKSWYAKGEKMIIRFGTNVEYAGAHQKGTEDIPERLMAPVRYLNGRWELIKDRGPAKKTFDRINTSINDYIVTGR